MLMLHFQSLASFFAASLLSSLVFGSIIAIAAWAFLRLCGTQSSRVRFAVWFSALLLVFIIPWLSGIFQSSSSAETRSGLTLPAYLAVGIFSIWTAGATLALLRVGFAFYQSLRLRVSSQNIDSQNVMSSIADLPGNFRGAELRVSDDVSTPTAIGFFRPMILIPSWALKELSSNELQAILTHELEHLRRWDDWTNFAQKVLSALLFFHPAIWWIDRNLALEREIACDDAVLARTPDRHAYAACLVRVAEKSMFHRGLALAQAIIGRVGQTTFRITQILAGSRPAKRVWKPAAYFLAAGSLSGVIFLAQSPLVSFESPLPISANSTASVTYATLASADDSAPAPHLIIANYRQPEPAHSQPVAHTTNNASQSSRAHKSVEAGEMIPPPELIEAALQQEAMEAEARARFLQAQFLQAQMFAAHARYLQSLLNDAPGPGFVFVIQSDPRPNQAFFIVWHDAPVPQSVQRAIPARKI
jgi:beta-lactamase regulating signal transducer with metallopeptidase domain